MRNRPTFGRALILGVGLLWGVVIVFGMRAFLNYESTAGTPGAPPAHWPSDSGIVRPNEKFTLVMLAHPHCPCTRASLAELEIVMAQLQGKVVAFVLFSKPEASAAEIQE